MNVIECINFVSLLICIRYVQWCVSSLFDELFFTHFSFKISHSISLKAKLNKLYIFFIESSHKFQWKENIPIYFHKEYFTHMKITLENWFFNNFFVIKYLFPHFRCLRFCCCCICSVNYLCKSSVECVGCAEWLRKEVVCFYYRNRCAFFLFLQMCYINIGWFIMFTQTFL